MKIVKLKGGLGNQMFQYAFAKCLEKHTQDVVKLDWSAYKDKTDEIRTPRLNKFNISLSPACNEDLKEVCLFSHSGDSQSFLYKVKIYMEKMLNKKYYFEKNRSPISIDEIIDKKYFDGYWQSWLYVKEVEQELMKDFNVREELSEKTRLTIEKINKENAVFVGVRRGDYLKEQSHYGSFSLDYYKRSMDYILEKIDSPVFYIFSNDIEYCKNNFNFDKYNIVFREKNDQVDDFEELMIMSNCKHAIIVNSTFNWWGARLIKNSNKIVCCPEKWFFDDAPIDIIPPEWNKVHI